MNKVIEFLKTNHKSIIKGGIVLFLLYWIIFVLTPRTGMSVEQKIILDSLSNKINQLHSDNSKLETTIQNYNEKISNIDNNINNLKNQKIIIKEYYHEKINGVDKLTLAELDSFFAKRYNY